MQTLEGFHGALKSGDGGLRKRRIVGR